MESTSSPRGWISPLYSIRTRGEVTGEDAAFSWNFKVEFTIPSRSTVPIPIIINGVVPRKETRHELRILTRRFFQLEICQHMTKTPDVPRFLAKLSLCQKKDRESVSIEVQDLLVNSDLIQPDSSAIWNLPLISNIALRALATYAEANNCTSISFPNTSTGSLSSLFAHGIMPDNPKGLLIIKRVGPIIGITRTRTITIEEYIHDQIKDPKSSGSIKIPEGISATLPKELIPRLTFVK
ncbi:MAG: hypothetical protein HY860_05435 [Chlamydiales bacterium]|nr:hypothetical protein [Chlamydiales bacterium]